MKSFYSIIFILFISEFECHLIVTQTKGAEEHTAVTAEDGTVQYTDKNTKPRLLESKIVTSNDNHVYLEDVFFKLKNQNWTKDEEPCLNRTLYLLKGLQNFSLWAVWEWDSISSEPMGLLYGNRYQLGNFDECLGAPWVNHPELKTKYCLANIRLERTDKAIKRRVNEPFDPYSSALDYIHEQPNYTRPLNELTWGICVPEICKTSTIERLLALMLSRSHLGAAGMTPQIKTDNGCQSPEPEPYDRLFYAFVLLIGILSAIAVVCTYYHSRMENVDTIKREIIQAFSLKYNGEDLLRMKREGIEVLYGIRYLTICFIVMDHQVSMSSPVAVTNGREVDMLATSTLGMFIVHDDLFVDTFFMLSGFLAAANFTSYRRLPNPIIMILKRYVRLIVAFAIAVFYMSAVFRRTGSGPLWPAMAAAEEGFCRKNWWLNLLMISNYVDTRNMCLVVSWYIPCDFHYFVVSILLFWLYKRAPRATLTLATAVVAASILVPGVIVYIQGLPAVQLFNYEFASNPRASLQFDMTYIKSHTRAGAYVIGFIAGCIFSSYRATGNMKRISQKWSVFGCWCGVAVMTAALLTGSVFLWREVPPLAASLYAAANRPAWAAGLAALVLCCALGHVPYLKSFLSMYVWVPLSRLAYGLYLYHTLFLFRSIFVKRTPQRFDIYENFNSSIGLILIGTAASAFIWFIAEAPVNNLVTLMLKKRAQPMSDQKAVVVPNHSNSYNGTGESSSNQSGQYLHNNLPSTVQLSSKI